MLIYAPIGHGKTVFVGTVTDDPRLMPALLLDLEGGIDSIESRVRLITLDALTEAPSQTQLDCVRITRWEDFQRILGILEKRNPYCTIAVDSPDRGLQEVHHARQDHQAVRPVG